MAAAVLASGAIACSSDEEQASYERPATVVELGESRQGSIIEETSITGHLEAVEKAQVLSRVAGRVQDVYVRAGDKVAKGQVLAQLDATSQKTKVDAAEAALAQAEAGLVQAQVNYTAAQTRVEQASENMGMTDVSSSLTVQQAKLALSQAKSSLASAQADYNDALLNKNRQIDLYNKGAVSSYSKEQAELRELTSGAKLKSAKEGVANAEEAVRLAENAQRQVNILHGDVKTSRDAVNQAAAAVEQARAGVQAARASLKAAQVDLNDMTITSPIAGVVVSRNVEPGQSLGANGGATLFSIVDNRVLEMIAPIDEKYRAYVQPGTVLDIKTAINPEGTKATVVDVVPEADPQSHSVKVRLKIPNENGMLVEGAYTEAVLPIRELKGVIVPRTAVNESIDQVFVMSFDGAGSEGKAKKHSVTMIYSTPDEALVQGVDPNLRVIISGAMDMADGEKVKTEAKAAAENSEKSKNTDNSSENGAN